ncbi:hypothetical protein WICPIJ_000152 [Wickerhamomyces pijperi]|uniref:Mitochondrial distribution and morphology protein 10 n=1 Tax=Wickerhamomyces pijperi TaxID=599730 RepID=A0A9P8TS59_WICPI|nr:hypothetical protein WICPIJ_000152 [Wickerhamomyces pijperi]
MDSVLRSFNKATGWNEDHFYENVVATSEDFKINISSKSSQNTATSLQLSNSGSINGSLAYLYSSAPLKDLLSSSDISLQEAIAGYKVLKPPPPSTISATIGKNHSNNNLYQFKPHSLYYGRMYFPGSALEAMIIKRITSTTQLLIKCVSSDKLKNNGTMTFYLQSDGGKFARELIYSTNESLFGLRFLYNFSQGAERLNTALYNNSSLSMGAEIWYGVLNMSPGVSTSLRYSTQSTTTGKPLTMTLALNPLLGHISSTYSVKTSASSTFSSRYDFNLYSYESDLSFGCELWKFKNKSDLSILKLKIDPNLPPHPTSNIPNSYRHGNSKYDQSVIEAFESLVRDTEFSSVVKLSTGFNDKNLKIAWEGKYKDFLISSGLNLQVKEHVPSVTECGLSIQSLGTLGIFTGFSFFSFTFTSLGGLGSFTGFGGFWSLGSLAVLGSFGGFGALGSFAGFGSLGGFGSFGSLGDLGCFGTLGCFFWEVVLVVLEAVFAVGAGVDGFAAGPAGIPIGTKLGGGPIALAL